MNVHLLYECHAMRTVKIRMLYYNNVWNVRRREERRKSQQVPSSWVRPGVFLPSYLHIFAHFREGAASSTAPLPRVSQAQLLLITTTSYRLDTYNVYDRFLYFKMCCINVILCLLVSQRRNYTRNITICNMPFICTYCTL